MLSSSNDLFCLLCTDAGAAAGVSLYRLGCRRWEEKERRRAEAAVEELDGWEFEAMRANYLALMDDALATLPLDVCGAAAAAAAHTGSRS